MGDGDRFSGQREGLTPAPVPSAADASRSWSEPIEVALERVRDEVIIETGGAADDHIPGLADVDSKLFGLALASRDGYVYRVGDTDTPFTIQSVAKPFVLALALRDVGWSGFERQVGVTPVAEAFDATTLDAVTGRPLNPMVSAGAMVTTSLVKASDPLERFERIRAMLSSFAGRELVLDEAVLASQRAAGDRDRALAGKLREAGFLGGDVDEVLDVYFCQCALSVTAADLAVMGATLANGGVNSLTDKVVIDRDVIAGVLTVMATCGMYDYAGEWLLRVGMPAKSGVSGGVVATSPGQFGIGAFSPRLDEYGNSVRGVSAVEIISKRFGLHVMRVSNRPPRPVFVASTADLTHSSRNRTEVEEYGLTRAGHQIAVCGVEGEIDFADTEALVHSLGKVPFVGSVRWIALDLHRITRLHAAATPILKSLVAEVLATQATLALADPDHRIGGEVAAVRFPSLDEALAWCEDQLLAEIGAGDDGGGGDLAIEVEATSAVAH